jgi:hypothetical protein
MASAAATCLHTCLGRPVTNTRLPWYGFASRILRSQNIRMPRAPGPRPACSASERSSRAAPCPAFCWSRNVKASACESSSQLSPPSWRLEDVLGSGTNASVAIRPSSCTQSRLRIPRRQLSGSGLRFGSSASPSAECRVGPLYQIRSAPMTRWSRRSTIPIPLVSMQAKVSVEVAREYPDVRLEHQTWSTRAPCVWCCPPPLSTSS